MAALALMDIFEDRHAFLRLYTTLEDSSHAMPDELSVYYHVGHCSTLYLLGRDLMGRQLSIHQKLEDELCP